jgi:hypothetical protein
MNPASDADTLDLSRACTALWTATLSLMTAFMHTAAPAHRYLLARRIARNLATLREQECFTSQSRDAFARLSRRWDDKADRLDPQEDRRPRGSGVLRPGWFNR